MSEAEDWLLERLKQQGCDVYVDRQFEFLRDRLAHAIRANQVGPVVAGRHNGKPETYAQVFERIYSTRLADAPRGTQPTKRVAT